MKIKTSNLTGVALDWAVAKAEYGERVVHYRTWLQTKNEYWKDRDCSFADNSEWRILAEVPDGVTTQTIKKASIDWRVAGPIIEREISKVFKNVGGTYTAQIRHEAPHPLVAHNVLAGWTNAAGKTMIEAAMRCYVTNKLGDEIEVPDELA